MALGADDRRFRRRSAVMGERTDFPDRVTTAAAESSGENRRIRQEVLEVSDKHPRYGYRRTTR
jgi:hypothetical protein